jgi:hypothetical protein
MIFSLQIVRENGHGNRKSRHKAAVPLTSGNIPADSRLQAVKLGKAWRGAHGRTG